MEKKTYEHCGDEVDHGCCTDDMRTPHRELELVLGLSHFIPASNEVVHGVDHGGGRITLWPRRKQIQSNKGHEQEKGDVEKDKMDEVEEEKEKEKSGKKRDEQREVLRAEH